MSARLGIVGARGHVGRELLGLLADHPGIDTVFVSSRQLEGQPVESMTTLRYTNTGPAEVAARAVDVCVLALPNGLSRDYVEAIDAACPSTVIVDLSGDHRFDDEWYYGLPELTRARQRESQRISNPGCYATAMQLAIWPAREQLASPPVCFGVSGFSGAGTAPSPRNDPQVLHDNLLPYALSGHLHEREVTRQLGTPVYFTPHVAAFFRGISMTVVMRVNADGDGAAWRRRYREAYANEALVEVTADIPEVRHASGRHGATVGGFAADGDGRLVVVATLDNLLKGAATQALQNINLACGYDELEGIVHG